MTFASKHGTTNTARFTANTEGRIFTKLGPLAEADGADIAYIIDTLYINAKGQYGAQPVAGVCGVVKNGSAEPITPILVNLPSHLTEKVKEIISDPESVQDINGGRAGFTIYTYTPKGSNRLCYSVDWVDILVKLPF